MLNPTLHKGRFHIREEPVAGDAGGAAGGPGDRGPVPGDEVGTAGAPDDRGPVPGDPVGASGARGDREPLSLERRLERVERIVEALSSERLELEDALRLFEEGVAHLRASETLLRETELRIEQLVDESSVGPLPNAREDG